MRIDLDDPIWTQTEVPQCTSVDRKFLDNRVQHRHITPKMVRGQRMFTTLQMIEVEITAQLAAIFKIPPLVGSQVARDLVSLTPHEILAGDANSIGEDERWVRAASHRTQVAAQKRSDGTWMAASTGSPDNIDLVFPVQMFARRVLQCAAKLLRQRAAGEQEA